VIEFDRAIWMVGPYVKDGLETRLGRGITLRRRYQPPRGYGTRHRPTTQRDRLGDVSKLRFRRPWEEQSFEQASESEVREEKAG
jgi:hypothetical protein